MKRPGFTLIEVMTVVVIVATLMMIAIPSLLNARRAANGEAAKANLRSLMVAAETYAAGNRGNYPVNVTALSDYLTLAPSFCSHTVHGYNYDCTFTSGGYNFQATPETVNVTGDVVYTATTGAVLLPL